MSNKSKFIQDIDEHAAQTLPLSDSERLDLMLDLDFASEKDALRAAQDALRANEEFLARTDLTAQMPAPAWITELTLVLGAWAGMGLFITGLFALAKLGGAS